jgi:hypothetical protein
MMAILETLLLFLFVTFIGLAFIFTDAGLGL